MQIEDQYVRYAIMGRNKEDYIKEAHRILEDGGVLYIIEPCKKWIYSETKENKNLKDF